MWLTGRLVPNLSTVTSATKRSCSMCLQSCLTQKGTLSRYRNTSSPDSPCVVRRVFSGRSSIIHLDALSSTQAALGHVCIKAPTLLVNMKSVQALFSTYAFSVFLSDKKHQLWLNRRSYTICCFVFLAWASMRQHQYFQPQHQWV